MYTLLSDICLPNERAFLNERVPLESTTICSFLPTLSCTKVIVSTKDLLLEKSCNVCQQGHYLISLQTCQWLYMCKIKSIGLMPARLPIFIFRQHSPSYNTLWLLSRAYCNIQDTGSVPLIVLQIPC